MVKKILLIAYHYPPIRGSSGIQRTLKFSQYLPSFGWKPAVLSVQERAYQIVSRDQIKEIPRDITVARAFALDTARHLAIRGSYIDWFALPDRWISWWIGGVISGLRLIRQERPDVLWSTYPIATAHLIGLTLHRLTGIPWIADFRDPMTEEDYPPNKRQWKIYRWIERHTIMRCKRAVFTTPSAVKMYAQRYPDIPAERWSVIANGYDEENFVNAERAPVVSHAKSSQFTLVHSGALYPSERDPRPFFAALADLKGRGIVNASNLKIVLRASGHDDYHRAFIEKYGIQDLICLEAGIPYEQALREMLNADGLFLIQAKNCNHQIPAKVYEYIRAQRPIFALTDSAGDTAATLLEAGIDTIAPPDDSEQIASGLIDFIERAHKGNAPISSKSEVALNSRFARTRELVHLLDNIIK